MAARERLARRVNPAEAAAAHAARLDALFRFWRTRDMLEAVLKEEFAGRVALVSSFGADSVVLLHLVASVDPAAPVVFVDTGRIFGATHAYRDELVARLGLSDVRVARPAPAALAAEDPDSALWLRDSDRCCAVRKVEPLADALGPFEAWISGRKRHQGGMRAALPLAEADGWRVKINPLAMWSRDHVGRYRRLHDLPEHPLVADGYRSIGCVPCTDRVAEGEDERNGRWRGTEKTECGIHLGLPGQEIDGSGI
jgi:phosphoadenosine phosphosulfate reductase